MTYRKAMQVEKIKLKTPQHNSNSTVFTLHMDQNNNNSMNNLHRNNNDNEEIENDPSLILSPKSIENERIEKGILEKLDDMKEKEVKQSHFHLKGLSVACFYMLVSVILILFNKATLSFYNFRFGNVLTMLQASCSIILILIFKKAKLIKLQEFSLKTLKKVFPLGISFVLYMMFGMTAIRLVNIPMYTTLRRTTILFVLIAEYYFLGKTPSRPVKFSVFVMVVGVLIAGARDLEFEVMSYIVVMLYNCSTSIYLVLINRTSKLESLESFDLMFYNSLISIPILLSLTIFTGELFEAISFVDISNVGFQVSLFGSCLMAFVLNYAIFLNTLVNSPLTQNISGQAKDVFTVILGHLCFSDSSQELIGLGSDHLNSLGIFIGFVGGCIYAHTKWKEVNNK